MEKNTQKKAEREFLICEYLEDETGKMRCDKPKMLPCGKDGQACRVWIHDWRERGSGPGFKFMIVYCKTHDRYYTVYPSGWAPYEREAIVPEAETDDGPGSWENTVFSSAVTDEWLKSYGDDGQTSWHTHRRRLIHCGRLLGLSGAFAVGEEVTAILGIPLHVHVAARRLFGCGDLASQRRAIASMLCSIVVSRRLWQQMIRAGHAAGVWGTPWHWTPEGGLAPVFRMPERAAVCSVTAGTGFDP